MTRGKAEVKWDDRIGKSQNGTDFPQKITKATKRDGKLPANHADNANGNTEGKRFT